MSSPDAVGNGVDRMATSDVTAIAGIAAQYDTRKSFRDQAHTTVQDGVTNGPIIEPPIDSGVIWQFSVAGADGRERALNWAEQAFRTTNRSPVTQNEVRPLKFRDAQKRLECIYDNIKGYDVVEVVPASDQSDKRGDRHQQAMLWTSYGVIGAGFFVIGAKPRADYVNSGIVASPAIETVADFRHSVP